MGAFGLDLRLLPKKQFGIGMLVLFVQLFLYINASAVYGEFAAVAKDTLLVYIIMLTSIVAVTGSRPDIIKGGFDRSYNFFLLFFATSFLLVTIPWIGGQFGLQNEGGIGVILLQVFAVAYTEEVVFRGILPEFLGDLSSNGLFAVFHYAVYGGSIPLVFFAFILGLVFAIIRQYFGITGAIGAHAGWNLKSLGVLDRLIEGSI